MTPKNQKLLTVGLRCGRKANRIINFTLHSYADLFEGMRKNLYCEYPAPKRKHWFTKIPAVGAALHNPFKKYPVERHNPRWEVDF